MVRKLVWLGVIPIMVMVLAGLFVFQGTYWAEQEVPTARATVTRPDTLMVDADLIRVGISDDAMTSLEYDRATLSAAGPYRVTDKKSGNVILRCKAYELLRVSRDNKGFYLETLDQGKTLGPIAGILVVAPDDPAKRLRVPSVTRHGKIPSYKGIFELTPGHFEPDKFTVVNVLSMQDYLKAVVPNELPIRYGYEAVKAQAVAARNYAIRPREKRWPQFDICDSQYCQAYYGANTEHPETTRALAETHGLVALYQGEPILALYSSAHGGHTENYENVFSDPDTHRFPGTPIPYLQGRPDMGRFGDLSQESKARTFYTRRDIPSYDVNSPNFRWRKQWTRTELERILERNLALASTDPITAPFIVPRFENGSRIGTLKALKIARRGVSGKAMALEVVGSNGTWTLQKEFVIRKVLGNNGRFLPSANVVFDHIRDSHGNLLKVAAHGGGMGHGVGMSQLGASYLAKHGKSFVTILQHYYRGVAIGSIPVQAKANQGMKTRFYLPHNRATLFVESTGRQPVRLAINNHELSVPVDAQGKASIKLKPDLLKTRGLNQLQIQPLEAQDTSVAKAWVEVYPPVQR